MPIEQWDRYRHDTFKDNPTAEEPFLPTSSVLAAVETVPTPAPAAAEKPPVYKYFEFVKSGEHVQNEGKPTQKIVPCEWYACKNKAHGKCKGKEDSHKVVSKATTGLLRHVKVCFGAAAWVECRLDSKGSKARRGADGSVVETYSFKVRSASPSATLCPLPPCLS